MLVLDLIKVGTANQVGFMLDYNYMAVHTKSVTLTTPHTFAEIEVKTHPIKGL